MPSPRRESIHNSNCGFRHHKRDKKMFSKNEDRNRNNSRGKKPKPTHLAPVVGLLPYPIKNVREFYKWHPRFVCIKSKNGVMELNKLGRSVRWVSRKDRSKLYYKAGNNINYYKMYFDVDLVYDFRDDDLIEEDLISNASTENDIEFNDDDDDDNNLFRLINLITNSISSVSREEFGVSKYRIKDQIRNRLDNIFNKYKRSRKLFYKFSNNFIRKLRNLGYNDIPEFTYSPFGVTYDRGPAPFNPHD